jgi:hypothetical protein
MFVMPSHLRSIVDHDGAVILDIPRNTMTTLNPTGAYIWQRLILGMDIDSIISELARETKTEETAVANDVSAFMEDLKSRYLITIS